MTRLSATDPLLPGRTGSAILLLLFVAIVMRLAAVVWTPLIPEEAYYWMYSQHPSLSYYDHPPMIAWTIRLGTLLFGTTEFGVRAMGTLFMLASSMLMLQFGQMWFGRRAGIWSAIALQVLPIYYGAGYIATMDSALIFYWMVCLVGVSFALQRNSVWGWYLAGVAVGAAALTKYTALFLGGGALFAVLAYRPWWKHLKTPHPYMAALIAIASFMPVVIWNAQNNWTSFRFQFVDRYENQPVSLGKPLMFLGMQLLILTPVLIGSLILIVRRFVNRPRRVFQSRWVVALSFSIPLIGAACQKSLSYEIHLNWTLPAYLSLMPGMMYALILYARKAGLTQWSLRVSRSVSATAVVCLAITIGITAYLLAIQPHTRWIGAFGPWRQLAKVVEDAEDRLQAQTNREPLVIGNGKYRTASVLAFYRTALEDEGRPSQTTTNEWIATKTGGLAYQYWIDRSTAVGRDCVIVAKGQKSLDELAPYFASFQPLDDPRLASCAPYRVAIARDLRP